MFSAQLFKPHEKKNDSVERDLLSGTRGFGPRTVYAGALEDLASLTRRPQPIAFDLEKARSETRKLSSDARKGEGIHYKPFVSGRIYSSSLQRSRDQSRMFPGRMRAGRPIPSLPSRGSLLILRAGSRSIPTCGRDTAIWWAPGRGAVLMLIGPVVDSFRPQGTCCNGHSVRCRVLAISSTPPRVVWFEDGASFCTPRHVSVARTVSW